MRKIKFRVWDRKSKRMLSPVDIFNEPGLIWEDTPEGVLQLNRIVDSFGTREELDLMQFTGLLDSKGKEIYEGDILHWIRLKLPITVDDYHGYRFMFGKDTLCRAFAIEGEVIGNIYENPDVVTI